MLKIRDDFGEKHNQKLSLRDEIYQRTTREPKRIMKGDHWREWRHLKEQQLEIVINKQEQTRYIQY